jgi:Cys-rich protein (TIGR01571 family)
MDCCKDCGICVFGYFCLPCLFGQNAEKIDNSSCCGMCCVYILAAECYLCWVPHMMKRKRLREKYGLKENPECGDCLTTLCCGPCAVCQEARELKSRGKFRIK